MLVSESYLYCLEQLLDKAVSRLTALNQFKILGQY
jgi:hypothetical protein